MRILGYDIRTSSNVQKKEQEVRELLLNTDFKNIRSALDALESVGGGEVRMPNIPLDESTLFEIADLSDTLRTVHRQLKKEIFRNGAEIKEKFASKCEECGKEFDNPVDECDDCKEAGKPSTNIRAPIPAQRRILEKILENCNENGQSLLDVSEQIEDDLNIIDDGYELCVKDYLFSEKGKLVGVIPLEFLRVFPKHIRMKADKTGRFGRDDEGNEVKTCVVHRTELFTNGETHCTRCGCELFPAHYRAVGPKGQFIHYIENEIYHKSKYKPSLTYGFSPIFSIWMKAVTLMNQDKYIKDYYTKQRPPRGLLFVKTPNMNSLKKAWAWMLDMFKQNPHIIPPIAIEGEKQGNQFVQFIDFMRGLDEMQFTQTREEYRRTIGAVYGVQPIFQNDVSTSGGLNNEGLQITVTNRASEDGQKVHNKGFFPWIAKQLEVTDYIIELNPSEEQDEMAELERESVKMQNARMMQAMGFDVTYNQDGAFEYEPTDVPVEPPQDGGMTEGLPQIGSSAVGNNQNYSGEPSNISRSAIKKKVKTAAEKETELIRENRKTPAAQRPHKFRPAKWTHPNGHPRCLLCGDEERIDSGRYGNMCEGASVSKKDKNAKTKSSKDDGKNTLKDDAPVTTETAGVYQPSFRGRRRRREVYLAIDRILNDVVKETKSPYDVTKAKGETDDFVEFIEENLFKDDFKGVTHAKSDIIKEFLVKALRKGYSMARVMKYIERVGGKNVTPFKAETIARTETQALRNTMREWSYKKVDPKEEMRYKWINPMDNRTSEICSNLVARTRGGVTLKRLRELVKAEAQAHGLKPREWTPHPNCRSTFVRVVKPRPFPS